MQVHMIFVKFRKKSPDLIGEEFSGAVGSMAAAASTQAGAGEEEGGGSSSSGPCVGALALLVDILLEPNSEERDATE